MDEALERWDRHALLGDMVRVIRAFRPIVVVSRWEGTPRDGHGQHQAAGALTPEAVAAAADPAAYPELAAEGLAPWTVLRLYVGGARENEAWQVRVDPGQYDPVIGDSYANLARRGLARQRSQTSGRLVLADGPAPLYFSWRGEGATPPRGESFFEGLPIGLADAYRLLGRAAPTGAENRLASIARQVESAREGFRWTDPAASAPALARGLALSREAAAITSDADGRTSRSHAPYV